MMLGYSGLTIIQAGTELLGIMCRVVLFLVLFNRFVPIYSGKNKKTSFALALVLIVASVVRWCINENGYPLWIIILSIVVMAYTLIWKREYVKEALFSLGLFVNLRYLSYFFVNSVVSVVSPKIMEGFEQATDIDSFMTSRTEIMYIGSEVLYILILIVELLPFIKLLKKHERISWVELCYLSVMNVAGIIMTRIMIGIAVIDTDAGAIVLLDEKPSLVWLLPVVAILIYLGELFAIVIWQKYNLYRQKSELYFVRSIEEESIRRRLDDTERYYEQVRKARHEMASHMTNIKGLAEQEHLEELSKYIEDIDDNIRSVELRYNTGNPITDVVVNDKCRKAEEKEIVFMMSFAFDDSWGIPVYDLSIVLSNILDNAIEAADTVNGELRYVNLKTIDRERVILLVCENGYDSSLQPQGDKENFWHGLGLKNVEDIAERFDGTVNIKKYDNLFKIKIMLKKTFCD